MTSVSRVRFDGGGALLVKWQREGVARLEAEKVGLETLSSVDSGLIVPSCRAFDFGLDGGGYLAMDWLDTSDPDTDFWRNLGRSLARLHRSGEQRFGFGSNNFIGRLPQKNRWIDSWPEFFLEWRLLPQVVMAQSRGRWPNKWERPFERLKDRLADILPPNPEISLVHGDLWSGNAMSTPQGPAVFDPAVYYGHREVDLAMTELFGGFSPEFYHAYDKEWPRDAGYRERADIYNLYHLINHLNIFGSGYAGSVGRILKRFN